ncbi:hypothetical protein OsI_07849 [Oryza sativa Indica Group]|uniref:NB-ARC domain-containing protein n=1 Tax=Oryza sativa subsp. indica TaxID=39946 RepID=B8AEP0_ORYSI|nr:hypothetical protein OsI_07849 [Oryza sativa Indica Group]
MSLGFLNGTQHESSYLIVLDDVWYENAQEWDNLIKDLPSKGATILTTRSTAVSSRLATMPTCKPYYLPALQQEFSYFCLEWVASQSGHYPTELYEVCRVVVEQCDGVPLLLKHACDFFSTSAIELWEEFTIQDFLMVQPVKSHQLLLMRKFWQRLFDSDLQQDWLSKQNEVLESALVSFRRLTSGLQNCLLYCSMFPLDYIFDVEELADRLAAQGFIPPMETFAQWRTFLQPLLDDCFYPEQEYDHGVKPMYRMHRIFHMYVKYIEREFNSIVIADQGNSISVQNSIGHVGAQGPMYIVKPIHKIHGIFNLCTQCMERKFITIIINYIEDQDESIVQNSIRHVSLIVGPSTESIPVQFLRLKDLRTLILLPAGQKNMSDKKCEIKEIPQVLWQSNRNLEVLSLHGTKIRKSPHKIELLHYLRYMDLSWTNIRIIPSSISKLQFLQILKLSHCEKLQKLHDNIRCLVGSANCDKPSIIIGDEQATGSGGGDDDDDDGARDLPATHGGEGDDDAPAGASDPLGQTAPSRHHHQLPAVPPQPSAGPIAEVAVIVEAVRIVALRRLLGCSGATPPPAPVQANCNVEMGLPGGESSASRPAMKPQPGS